MSILSTLAPTILSGVFKYLKANKTSLGIKSNPKATNTGVMTALVTITITLLGSYGVTTTGLEPVIASVFGTIGVIYTWWRMEK